MKSKYFTDLKKAKEFAQQNKGFIEYFIDEKLNKSAIVFYK